MSHSKIGKYILESISIGLYNNPLMIYREYIQNSVDSIDCLNADNLNIGEIGSIEIIIDGTNRSIAIRDNGKGVSREKILSTMCSIGKSEKQHNINRGFRGIGRLGGLGYSDKLRFVTKAVGEQVYSIVTWHSDQLVKLLNNREEKSSATKIIEKTVEYSEQRYNGSINDHFFITELYNVESSRDVLLDVPLIKSYISQIAPVPFNRHEFRLAEELETTLRTNAKKYSTYNIQVNGERILKPYKDAFYVGSKTRDQIQNLNYFSFDYKDSKLAFGWVARTNLLGAIKPSNIFEGIRVRSGNILVGDKNLLTQYFKEERFNNYLIGEIYVTSEDLILNSRRDDFEDNRYRDEFIKSFIKLIGIPYSREIRDASIKRAINKKNKIQQELFKKAQNIIESGYLAKNQKNDVLKELQKANCLNNSEKINRTKLIKKIQKAQHYLTNNNGHYNKKTLNNLIKLLNLVYDLSTNKMDAETIIVNVLKKCDFS